MPEQKYMTISGETMGTYYRISCLPVSTVPSKEDFDSLLVKLNQALSTYEPSSVISQFNRSSRGVTEEGQASPELWKYFMENLSISEEVYKKSNGAFDPTVMPLVNYWGFGYEGREKVTFVDSIAVDSLLAMVGLEKVKTEMDQSVTKVDSRVQLDFSAVAKGYAIDELGRFLEEDFGIKNYLVDIGGESIARGKSPTGQLWRIGINKPVEGGEYNAFEFIVELDNMAIATSGNYRNYYEVKGERISHTINAKTGFYERNDLLSATILSADCAHADAWATTCMAMGFARAKAAVEQEASVEAIFIYLDAQNEVRSFVSANLSEFVKQAN